MLMYNLIEYSSNYLETTRRLWCNSKDDATDFNANAANIKSFKCKPKLLGNTEGNYANEVLNKKTILFPLKYLSNFWRSLEMSLIYCKGDLKPKWTKYCVFSATGNDNDINDNGNANDIIFTIKDKRLYVVVVTLSESENWKLSKLLSKRFERSVYYNEYKTNSKNKNMTNTFIYFLKSNFFGVSRLFVLVYSHDNGNSKLFKAKG